SPAGEQSQCCVRGHGNFFFSSRRRHTRFSRDWSSDVCSSDLSWFIPYAQGGSLEDVCAYGMNQDCGLLVNSTRSIIYASSGEDFAEKAREEALKLQQTMEKELMKANII